MFLKGDIFEKLLCCRRKVVEEDGSERGVEQVVLQHTNNNQTEYITSAQLVQKLKGGTTAVVALVREKRLVVAWLGDSQALLVRRRTPVRMVEPHKPELPVERDRVEEMGGLVLNVQGTWRVLGQLAVSRAIGDLEYKPYVSSECDIKSLEIEGDEDFLILACDGLWDTLSPEGAVNVVYAYLTRNDGDTDGVGRCLVEAARNTGSEDNITAVVVFLRPVATIMEEEAQRIAQGQVPDPVPEVVLCKDSTPSSINAIFAPPVAATELNNEAHPAAVTPLDAANKMDTEEAVTPAPSVPLQMQEEPMEGSEAPFLSSPARDLDLPAAPRENNDQGAFNPHDAPTPTAEEVDAALAELDSIPDEVCETGDVEEEDEEEEEWSYYRMDLQTQTQTEDVLVSGSSALQDSDMMDQDQGKAAISTTGAAISSPDLFDTLIGLHKETNLMETSISNVGEYLDNPESPSSPPVPGSPRSVEGFVTSVELNTPDESLGKGFPPGHTQDMNGSGIGQSSGPFSVYVSSSPEPVSLDPLQASADINGVSDMTNGQVENNSESARPDDFSPVEIVHAQSTVEVLESPVAEKNDSGFILENESSMLDLEPSKAPAGPGTDVTFIPEPAVEPVAEVPVPVYIEEGTPISEGEPEMLQEYSADVPTDKDIIVDLLSKEDLAEHETETSFREELSPSMYSPQPEREPVHHEFAAPVSSCLEPEVMSQSQESAQAPLSPVLSAPSPVSPAEPAPVPLSPVEVTPAPLSPVQSPPSPVSPVQSALVPLSLVEVAQAPLSPVQAAPAPVSPVESAPTTVSPVESAPVPVSPVQSAPLLLNPDAEEFKPTQSPLPISPANEAEALGSPFKASPEPAFLLEEPAPQNLQTEELPVSPAEEPSLVPVPASPVMESEPVQAPPAVELSVPPVTDDVESQMKVERAVEPETPLQPSETIKTQPEVTENKDEILINNGTVVIPVVQQEEVKEPEPKSVKSPVKSKTLTKTPTDKSVKAPGRAAPGKSAPARTTASAAKSPTKTADKKPSPLKSSTQRSTPTTKPASEKTTPTTKPGTSRTTAAAATKQPAAKPAAAKPPPKTTTTRLTPTTFKPTEKKAPKPLTPTAPRANLSKPSAAASKPTTKPSTGPTGTIPTTTATRRPASAPASKAGATKVNGTATKPAPRTTTTRPATASTVPRKPLSSAKPVPEKETKNTTNRMLSTTTKTTRPPGTARPLSSKTSATGQSTLTKTTTAKVNGTSTTATTTTKGRVGSVTKSSTTTTKTTGVGAKKTTVTKTSTTKTKAVAAAVSTKVEKSEVIAGAVANGENKIAHEETSVEVIEKCAAEDNVQCSTTDQVNNAEPVELIVNGDH